MLTYQDVYESYVDGCAMCSRVGHCNEGCETKLIIEALEFILDTKKLWVKR